MRKKRLGVMGGTFDPIHNGHLVLAENARVEFELDDIIFIPTGNPPHKDKNKISFTNHRYEMVLLATNSNPCFNLSSMEMEQSNITYTVDTVEYIQNKYENIEIYFILGADSFCNIRMWKDYKKLLSLCNIIIAKRLDTDDNILNQKLDSFKQVYRDSIYILQAPLIDISSTDIRKRVKKGMTIKYLVPEAVELFIEKNNLYK